MIFSAGGERKKQRHVPHYSKYYQCPSPTVSHKTWAHLKYDQLTSIQLTMWALHILFPWNDCRSHIIITPAVNLSQFENEESSFKLVNLFKMSSHTLIKRTQSACSLWLALLKNYDAESPLQLQHTHTHTHKHAWTAHRALLRLPPRTKALPSHWLANGATSWHLGPAPFHVPWVS